MPKFEVRLDGHTTQWYTAHFEVEAENQGEADRKARALVDDLNVDWGEPSSMDKYIELDEVEVEEFEIEDKPDD